MKSEKLLKELHSGLEITKKELLSANRNIESKHEQLAELQVKNVSINMVKCMHYIIEPYILGKLGQTTGVTRKNRKGNKILLQYSYIPFRIIFTGYKK